MPGVLGRIFNLGKKAYEKSKGVLGRIGEAVKKYAPVATGVLGRVADYTGNSWLKMAHNIAKKIVPTVENVENKGRQLESGVSSLFNRMMNSDTTNKTQPVKILGGMHRIPGATPF